MLWARLKLEESPVEAWRYDVSVARPFRVALGEAKASRYDV